MSALPEISLNRKLIVNLFLIFYFLTCASIVQAKSSSIHHTQDQLKELDLKINHVKAHLNSVTSKRRALTQELSNTEKQIGEGVHQLRTTGQEIQAQKIKISALQKKINWLNHQLITQQKLLAQHLRSRYQMSEYEPLKWLMNQDDPGFTSRLLTYYQYIIKSRQQLIDEIDETRKNMNESKEKLRIELNKNQTLQEQLTHHQYQLKQNKIYHTTLIDSLNNEIRNKQSTLKEFQRNKTNLTRLLKSLSQQSIVMANKPFIQMRKKLPYPIQVGNQSIRRMNHGMTFFADEGTAVTAVYPGKVVFSDWLKGYGLLLIIDHGQGYMSLYAHNQSLFKRKGERVYQNEQIASVGHSGGIKQNGLYFEIRHRGKAISASEWLQNV